MPVTGVHFNGSVNLADTETVMREVAKRIPAGLRRITDGETGERRRWVSFQFAKFVTMREFVMSNDGKEAGREASGPKLDLARGVAAENIAWPDLGYAENYVQSYRVFAGLRDQGVIPAGVRFQLQFPTPRAAIGSFFAPDNAAAVMGSYETALFRDVAHAMGQWPHRDIAIQWDVAVEIILLAVKELGGDARKDDVVEHRTVIQTGNALDPSRDELVADVARCVQQVPRDVPVGVHLCYGDFGHRHAVQPRSLSVQVEFMNSLAPKASRALDWAAITVPQNRGDDAFFVPLRELNIGSDTELDFGIVPYHPSEQPPGTTGKQIALIDRYLAESPAGRRDWGVCQECGLGRVEKAAEVLELLDLHREIFEQYGAAQGHTHVS